MQLAEMGFPLEACRKAVYYTGNMGPEMAFNWIIAHMEEPGRGETKHRNEPSCSSYTVSALMTHDNKGFKYNQSAFFVTYEEFCLHCVCMCVSHF